MMCDHTTDPSEAMQQCVKLSAHGFEASALKAQIAEMEARNYLVVMRSRSHVSLAPSA